MNIARVVGNVVATRKDDTLVGSKLMVAQPLDLRLQPQGGAKVMVDTVGAGIGELVLFVTGAAARNAAGNKEGAIDAAVVGIIDDLDISTHWLECTQGVSEEEVTLE